MDEEVLDAIQAAEAESQDLQALVEALTGTSADLKDKLRQARHRLSLGAQVILDMRRDFEIERQSVLVYREALEKVHQAALGSNTTLGNALKTQVGELLQQKRAGVARVERWNALKVVAQRAKAVVVDLDAGTPPTATLEALRGALIVAKSAETVDVPI